MLRCLMFSFFAAALSAQSADLNSVPLQPLAQQVRRLEDALNYLGQPFPAKTREAINDAIAMPEERAAIDKIQQALDPFVIARVDINGSSAC